MRYDGPDEEKQKNCAAVLCDENDWIMDMEGKPVNPRPSWCCPPFYFYIKKKSTLIKDGIEVGCGKDALESYIAWLCKQVPAHALEMPGKRYDIRDLEDYKNVQKIYCGLER